MFENVNDVPVETDCVCVTETVWAELADLGDQLKVIGDILPMQGLPLKRQISNTAVLIQHRNIPIRKFNRDELMAER